MPKDPVIVTAKTKTTIEPPEKLSERWKRSHAGDTEGMSKSLRDIGVTDRGGYLTKDFNPATQLGQAATANAILEKEREKARIEGRPMPAGVETSGVDKSGKLMTLQMAGDMFDEAERLGYKTADQFRTAYDNLKNASQRTKSLWSSPEFVKMTETEGASLKNVLADKFQRLINEKGAEKAEAKAAPKIKVTKAVIAPESMPMGKPGMATPKTTD